MNTINKLITELINYNDYSFSKDCALYVSMFFYFISDTVPLIMEMISILYVSTKAQYVKMCLFPVYLNERPLLYIFYSSQPI